MPTPQYDLTAEQIAALSARAYERVVALVRQGSTAREAISAALSDFSGPYYEIMANSLSHTLAASIGTDAVRDWPVRGVTLSTALYHDAREVAVATAAVVAAHTKWQHATRKLALEIYEGYNFKTREVLRPAVGLPKYMRNAAVEGEIVALLSRMQASQLKTGALKAGYMEALDAILNGAGQNALEKALWVATQERYRYFANRIAQTELHRAHTAQRAREFMEWGELEVVEYRLSASHPKPDICDVFARQDLHGLGPGRYPKAECPAPPIHPHCRCLLAPILGAKGTSRKQRTDAAAEYLRSLKPNEARQIAGSKAKLEEMLQGRSPQDVWNQGRPEGYRIEGLGGLAERQLPGLTDLDGS